MKRRGSSSTRSTRLIAQQSSADQSVTLFKLEDPDDDTPDPSVAGRHSKRIKVDDDRDKSASSQKAKGKKGKAKEIKKALDTPHPAPARWRESYDAIREMRARFPAPVDTMGCDTAKWKETDPRVTRLSAVIPYTLTRGGFPEQAFRDAHLAHALLADQGRSDRRSGRQAARCAWRHAQPRRAARC